MNYICFKINNKCLHELLESESFINRKCFTEGDRGENQKTGKFPLCLQFMFSQGNERERERVLKEVPSRRRSDESQSSSTLLYNNYFSKENATAGLHMRWWRVGPTIVKPV